MPNDHEVTTDAQKQLIKLGYAIAWLFFCTFVLWRFIPSSSDMYILAIGIYGIYAFVFPEAGLGEFGKNKTKSQLFYLVLLFLLIIFLAASSLIPLKE